MKSRALFGLLGVLVVSTVGCSYVRGTAEVGDLSSPYAFSVELHATSGPLGTASAYGRGGDYLSGRVTCLAVAGNRATIGVANELGSEFRPGGLIFVEDNGSPGVGVDVVNHVSLDAIPTTCQPPTDQQLDVLPETPGLETISSGDIEVGVLGVTATHAQASRR